MYANANIADALIGSELVILKTFTESRLIVANVTVTGPTQLTIYPTSATGQLEGCNYPSVQPAAWPAPFRAYFANNPNFFADPTDFGPGSGVYAIANNSIYFNSRSIDNVVAGGVVVPVLSNIMTVDGAQYLTFSNIDFRHTTWTNPSTNGYIGGQSGNTNFCTGNCTIPAIITISNANNIVVQNSTVAQSGGHGIAIQSGTSNISITGNTLSAISGNGIVVGTFVDSASGAPNNISILNNTIDSVGTMYDGVGILGGYLTNSSISSNLISYTSYSGISLGWFGQGILPTSKCNIANNEVAFTNMLFSDGAGIYVMEGTNGDNISNNYVHDILFTDAGFANNIRTGLYLDHAASGVYFSNNQLSNLVTGIYLQTDPTVPAVDNTILGLNLSNVTTPVPSFDTYALSNTVQSIVGPPNQNIIGNAGPQ
jgi:hypothetical protein